MHKRTFRTAVAGFLVAVGVFIPLINARFAHAATSSMTESQRVELLQSLLDKLIDLLEQLYPQINWNSVTNHDVNDDSNDDGDDDDDNDSDDDDDNDSDDDDDNDSDDDDDNDSDDENAIETDATSPVGNNQARANFEITFSISAFGDDIFIEKNATRDSSVSTSEGITYVIQDGSGDEYTGGDTSDTLESDSETGDTSTHFKIEEGDHRSFTLHIALDNTGDTAGYYRAKIVGMAFDDDATPGGEDTITTIFKKAFTDTVYVDDES